MTFAREAQCAMAAMERRPGAWPAIQRSAAATARTLQQRLGNRATQALFDGDDKKNRSVCDKKCGTGATHGNTECEIDEKSGFLTGKVKKEVFDKNPCTRPCVEVHEGVHAKTFEPICAATKKCIDAAKDDDKKFKCLDKLESDIKAAEFGMECAAYTAEAPCLADRAKKAECKTADGKKRFDEQTKMVTCYKNCFCAR